MRFRLLKSKTDEPRRSSHGSRVEPTTHTRTSLARLWGKVVDGSAPAIRLLIELLLPPYNLPLLAGLGFLAAGLVLILLCLKEPWYQVPVYLVDAPVVEQLDKLPTLRVPAQMEAITRTSRFEYPAKVIVLLSLLAALFHVVRDRLSATSRAHALGTLAAICLTVGLAFSHLVVVDDPEVSHLGAWMFSQHDGLAWYGGDTYTSREYEIHGGAWELSVKDPPKFLSTITPPYLDADIASLGDFLTWAGLCEAFWVFMGKGWAYTMMGALLLLVGVLSTRLPGQTRGLSSEIVIWVLIRSAVIVVPWILIVSGRTYFVAQALEDAQTQYELGDNAESLRTMKAYRTWMPCLEFDSGLMLQEGILERTLHIESPRSEFAKAYLLESSGYANQAQEIYLQLMDSELLCVRREAARCLLRRAIVHFNSGSEEVAKQLCEQFRVHYPCMVKASYLRMLIAVRDDDFDTAQDCLQGIYASVAKVGMPESRGYRTSGHQHLAQLAFDRGDWIETRRQVVYRMEQQPK